MPKHEVDTENYLPKIEISRKYSLIWEISPNRSLMIQLKCTEDK